MPKPSGPEELPNIGVGVPKKAIPSSMEGNSILHKSSFILAIHSFTFP